MEASRKNLRALLLLALLLMTCLPTAVTESSLNVHQSSLCTIMEFIIEKLFGLTVSAIFAIIFGCAPVPIAPDSGLVDSLK
ncbi:hypothetical protein RRG08_024405 [Elysia crispata]|uniref:Uncharacterized protein n=1 Tax=Elysia crispata TaxID=231223 RepID=A0AAE0YPX7_9GAST|nr:hypothetical protein RRG08_024405 [Elysia crispata]